MIKNHLIVTALVFVISSCANDIEDKKNLDSSSGIEYTCENGKKLKVVYFTTGENIRLARIQLEGAEHDLKSVVSASGAKYSNGRYIWWTKNSSGFLEIDSVITMKNCVSSGKR